MATAVINETLVGLVAHHHDVALGRSRDQSSQVAGRDHPARRVRGRIDEDHASPLADRCQERLSVDREAVVDRSRDRHANASGEPDLFLEAHPGRSRIDDLVAVVDQDLEDLVECGFGAHGNEGVGQLPGGVVEVMVALSDGLAKIRDAGCQRISGEAFGEGLPGRLDGDWGRRKIGLASAQVNDLVASGLELLGATGNLHRGGFCEPLGSSGKMAHDLHGIIAPHRGAKTPQRTLNMYRKPILVLALALLLATAIPAAGQIAGMSAKKATLKLTMDRTAYEPGSVVRLAGLVEIEKKWHVNSNTPTYDYLIPTVLSFELPEGFDAPNLRYPTHKMQEFEFTDEPIAVYDGKFPIFAEITLPQGVTTEDVLIEASLRYQACNHSQCLAPTNAVASLELTVGPGGESTGESVFAALADGGPAGTTPAAATAEDTSLAWILLLAMVGGLILNAMPCVLPVLSLKVFGLVKSATLGRSHLVVGSLATAGGILLSFWALAGLAVGAKAAGAAIGWGIQFQQPGFVTFLAVVIVLFSLNMWGLFEIPLPQSLAQLGGAGAREGLAGHFLSGLFATLMATPCSAPFLGTAIGFALGQSAATIFAIFTAIGLGLSLPYLLLAAFPGVGRILPKPGEWMMTFKGVMGFLLAAAAVWLFYVLANQVTSESVAFIQVAVLTLALFVWLHQHGGPASFKRRFASVGIVFAAVGAIALAVQSPAVAAAGSHTSTYHEWVAFDEAEAQRLASEQRLVFVDVTADWCVTCKAIERTVLETQEIADAFKKHDVVPMKADWTNRDDTITAFLARHGKAAVPFYVLYRPGQEPYAFGEVVSKKALRAALDEAGTVASLP
jgi:suppressor for copper-sensitivity B